MSSNEPTISIPAPPWGSPSDGTSADLGGIDPTRAHDQTSRFNPASPFPGFGGGAGGGSGATSGGGWPNAMRRPRPLLASLIAALAGAFLVGGIATVVGDKVDGHTQLVAFIVGVAFVLAGLVLGSVLPEEVRPTATVLAGAGAVTAVVTALAQQRWVDNRWIPVLIFAAISAVFGLLWWSRPLRDRTFLFGVSVIAAEIAVVWAIALLFGDDEGSAGPIGLGEGTLASGQRVVAIASAVVGAIMLAIAWKFARSGRQGLATALLLGGVLGSAGGASTLASDSDDWVATLLLLASGALIVIVGTQLHRRGTSWSGVVVFAAGLLSAISSATDTGLSGGILAIVFGVILFAVAMATRTVRGGAPPVEA